MHLRLLQNGKHFPSPQVINALREVIKVIFSYTQIASYLRCPRSYRYRYLDGWREKETRAAMAFGRCFEKALAAYFKGEDCGATLFKEWGEFRDAPFAYKKGETWDRLVHQGVHLLQRFVQDDRVHIPRPHQDLQIKVNRELPNENEFVAYIDAIGELDGTRCLMDWKTTGSRYSESPAGLLSLDPQLICYSWITGISDVALIVFVRKHQPEIQYLKASISEKQRMEFARLLENSIDQIEAAQFPSHSGIRFPQNGCMSCSYLGLCIDNQPLIDANLIRTSGVNDLAWLDELVD
jgi:PD-(D/E)XK nuclease superfamily